MGIWWNKKRSLELFDILIVRPERLRFAKLALVTEVYKQWKIWEFSAQRAFFLA